MVLYGRRAWATASQVVLLAVLIGHNLAQEDLKIGRQACGDMQCKDPISIGMTLLNYRANSNAMLSFKTNTEVRIISKPQGDTSDLWGVEINGKRGFVNRRHLREMRILVKEPKFVPGEEPPKPADPMPEPTPSPKASPPLAAAENPPKQEPVTESQPNETVMTPVEPSPPSDANSKPADTEPVVDASKQESSPEPVKTEVDPPAAETKVPPVEISEKSGGAPEQQAKGSATVETATEEYPSNQNYNPMEPDIDPQADYGVVMPGSLPVTQNDPVPHFNPSPDVVQETYQPDVVQEAYQQEQQEASQGLPDLNQGLPEIQPDIPQHQTVVEESLPLVTEPPPTPIVQNEQTLPQDEASFPYEPIPPSTEDLGKIPDFGATENDAVTSSQSAEDGDGIVKYYLESSKDFIPEWLHKSIHGKSVDGVSPQLALILATVVIGFVILHIVHFLLQKTSNERPLKLKIAHLEQKLFVAQNEAKIIKREMDQLRTEKSLQLKEQATVVDGGTSAAPPIHMVKELESARAEVESLKVELDCARAYSQDTTVTRDQMVAARDQLAFELDAERQRTTGLQAELREAESVMQELIEDKKKNQMGANQELHKAFEALRDQLNSQKDSVQKMDHKIQKRERELKEKIQESRKLKADAANANLELEKTRKERDVLKKSVEVLEAVGKDTSSDLEKLKEENERLCLSKQELVAARDAIDTKDSEIEDKTTEIEALKDQVQTLETILKTSGTRPSNNNNKNSKKMNDNENNGNGDGGDDDEGGWDNEDVEFEDISPSPTADDEYNLDLIQDNSRLKVDLRKAQTACSDLTDQLTKSETDATNFKEQLTSVTEELNDAREAKDQALKDKFDLEHKHEVLTHYFNQRNSELQKQLGLQTARLDDAEQGSESTAKKLTTLCDELETVKSENKTLKHELEEQERSLKSQIHAMEKKQHESWVTVRQEGRKIADAKNEMSTLRNRLTLAETKLVEKDLEIKSLSEQNSALVETVEKINRSSVASSKPDNGIYTNGNSIDHHNMSGPGSLGDSSSAPESMSPPPDLPELPDLPPLPPMGMPVGPGPEVAPYGPMAAYGAHPSYAMHPYPPPAAPYPADARPAPLGRRSPPPAARRSAYRRSPSPSENDSRYAMSDSDARYETRGGGGGGRRAGYASDYNSGYESGGGRRRTDYRSDYSEYDHHGGPASSSRRRGHQHEHSYISEDEYRHGGSNGRRHRQGAAGGGDRLHPPRSSAKKKEGPKTSSPMVDSYS